MSKLSHATIVPHRSSARGHADHGWLNSYHTFSFADYYDPEFMNFGCLRVLNEDRVAPGTGFPTHPHRDAEIFSYILSGELTHRDSMIQRGTEGKQGKQFYKMKRGDVQFTTGGTGQLIHLFKSHDWRTDHFYPLGIAHSEQNEHQSETVHFLQIWALPWKKGLIPQYHTLSFDDKHKQKAFLPILSPLAAGEHATAAEEKQATPNISGTIPIHADLVMGAGLIGVDKRFKWRVGGPQDGAVANLSDRKVYVHLPMTKNGNSKIRLDGREDAVLSEGDGAFVKGVNVGDELSVESIGEAEAEVIVLDSN
jgi:redox-sensitive bicupin YhaK (pirin superfamily)